MWLEYVNGIITIHIFVTQSELRGSIYDSIHQDEKLWSDS
jgi:hypothetical protein